MQHNDWLFYIQPSSGLLFTKKTEDNNYLYTIATTIRKNYALYNSEGEGHLIDHLQNDCIPTNLRLNRKTKSLVATFNNPELSETTIKKEQSDWKNSFIGNTTILDNNKLLRFISQEEFTIFIASDGSVHNYEGTFGIAISDGSSLVATNNGKFYSVDFCESSYRSELYAMLSGVLTFKSLCIHSNIIHRAKIRLQLISDCKTLVNKVNNRLQNRRTTNQHRDSDFDLELHLLHELQSLNTSNTIISITHVRSHQELKKVKSALSHSEFLNRIADNLTKTARAHRRKSKYISLPQNPIDFTINNIPINSKYALRSK
jgi:ribonuclease HI